ncbi:MAG: CDP-glucose 4,6-dehydratase [Bacillota bacterium]
MTHSMFNGVYKDRTVLVTGHTGFKGSWMVLWLSLLGTKVIGYALDPPTEPSLFNCLNLKDRIVAIKGDICNYNHLKNILEEYRPEIVFHLAAQSLVRCSYLNPVDTFTINVMGTVHLLEAVRQVEGVKALVNVTSDKCYENKNWIWGYRESDRLSGSDPYSCSKSCAELVTKAYIDSFFDQGKLGLSLASVRAGNVIGGGDWSEDRLIPDCIKAFSQNKQVVIRYPNAVRPWQHVLEPLYGYMLLAQRLLQDGPQFMEAWNFGPDNNAAQPVRSIVEQIVEIWGEGASWTTSADEHPPEANCLKLDCGKAKARLGWSPQWDLPFALRQTVEWYKAYYRNKDVFNLTVSQIKSYEDHLLQEGR